MKTMYRLSVLITRAYLTIVGNYKVINKDRLKSWKGCIVAANHVSYHDPPFVGSIIPCEISYLAKSELFKNPLLGRFLRHLNALPVTRGRIDRETMERIKKLISQGNSIMMFPEGSRKSSTVKPGIGILAYETGAPILPILLENTDNIVQCLIRKKGVRIVIGEMINTQQYCDYPASKETYRLIAEDVMKRIYRLRDDNKIS